MQTIQKDIEERISAEFSQDRISETVKAVGAREAERILYQQLQPAIERVESEAASVTSAISDAQARVATLEKGFIEQATPPTLSLKKTHVDVLPDGLRFVATIEPSKKAPIGFVPIQVRSTQARILDVSITGFGGSGAFIPVHRVIASNGDAAALAVVPLLEATFWMNVVVSGSTSLSIVSPRIDFRAKEFRVEP